MAITRTVLLSEELESLRQLACKPAKRGVPAAHGERLIACGFAKIQSGTLRITPRGVAKLSYEATCSDWFARPV